jgi:hypothetical protein
MPLTVSVTPFQFNVTWESLGTAVTVPFVGTVVSRIIEAEYGFNAGVVLPHMSLNHTLTVLGPFPDESVQVFVDVNALNDVQLVELLMHI